MKSAIILAAGKGTRMVSSKNKVMHEVLGKPMIGHVVDNVQAIHADKVVVVVGHQAESIQEYLRDRVEYAIQKEQLGTGHAIMQVDQLQDVDGQTLVLYGDCPLVSSETMQALLQHNENKALTVLTAIVDNPNAYGRIIKDESGNIAKIVEAKDASIEQLKIKEINTGIYCFNTRLLFKYIFQLTNNNQKKEYYLTDLVEMLITADHEVDSVVVSEPNEVMGINDRLDLVAAHRWLQQKVNRHWMLKGVTIIDPDSTTIDIEASIGEDTIIYPNVTIQKQSRIGKKCILYPNSFIVNSEIGDETTIDSSRISDSKVGNQVTIGPFAHLRNGTLVMDKNRIGNFVEMKNTTIKEDSRCAHLTYLGDAEVGSKVNLGCGVITVNYDGKNKFKTIIKDGAFIGSNVNLIAPITIGENAVVAAGTTANKDVGDGDMAIGRVRQENKPNYGNQYKNK